ncbi:MAG: hypothetical protein AAGF81_16150 [Pseudomonadota bacterium]
MSPYAIPFLFSSKGRPDHRTPNRREDEEPLHFVVSNATYRLVVAGDEVREKLVELWKQYR